MSFLSISASRALLLLLTTSSLLFFVSVSAARVPLGAGDLDVLSSNDTLAADEELELDDTDYLDDDQLATALGETEPAQSFTCPNNEAYRKTKRGCICRKGYGTFVHGWKRGPSNPQAKRYPSIFPSDCRYHKPGTDTNLFFPKKQGRCFCFTCPTYARTRYVSPGRGFLNSYGSGCYPYRYFYARVRIDGTTCEAIADNPALNTQIQATITKVFRAKFLTYNNTFSPVANAFTCTTGVNGGAFVGFRLGYLGPFAAAQTQMIRGILRNICRFTTLCRELESILPPGSSLNPIGEAGPKPLDPVEPTPSPPVPSVSPDPTIGRLCSDSGVCATGIINDADCGQGATATGIRQTAADCVEFCAQRTDGGATFALFGASGQCKCYRGGCDIMAGSFTIYRFDTVQQSPSPGVSPTPQSPSPSTPNPQSPNPQSPTPSPPSSPSPNTPSPSPGGQSPAPTSPAPTPTPAPPSVCAAQPFSNGVQCARLVSEDSDCSQNALDALADINLLTSLGLSVGVLNTITLTTCVTVLCPALALGNPSYALYAPETLGLGVGLRCKCYSAATVPRGACTQRAGSYDVYQYDPATTPSPSSPPTPGNSPSPAVPVSPSTPPTSPSTPTPPTPTPAPPQVCAAAPLTNGVQCADLVREDSDCSQGALDPLLNLGILASLGLSVDALNTLTLTTCVTVLCPALALGNPSYALYAPETLGLGVGLRCKCFSEAAVPRGSCAARSGAYDVYQYEAVPTPTPTPTPPTPIPSPSPSLPPTPEPTPSPPAATAVKVRSNSDCVEAIVDLTTLPTLPIALTEEDCVYRTCAGVPGRTYALWNSLGLLVCKCYRTTTCSPGLLSLGFEVWRYTN